MPVIKLKCPQCGKQTEAIAGSELQIGDEILVQYTCGHTFAAFAAETIVDHTFTSLDGTKKAYEYQEAGVKFLEACNYRGLIADGMGLGKTIQAALAVKNNPEKLLPCLIIVQSATTYQWAREWETWVDNSDLAAFPIIGTQGLIPVCFKVYIVSRDTLARKNFYKKLLKLNFKCIIVDEVQAFKNGVSKRTDALQAFLKESKIEHVIMLSGTPIKNRASEYFTALNILAPEYFPNRARFYREWLIPNEKGVYTRLNPYRIDRFRDLTSKWVLRREKEDVLKDLPPFSRYEQFIYIDDPEIKESYNREISLFDNFMQNTARISAIDILGWLAKFRRITGNAKMPFVRSYIEEFMDSNPDEKLCVGIHHESVREALYEELRMKGYNPLQLSGKDSAPDKARIVYQFEQPKNNLLIANILAGGVGLNLQFCNTAIVMERQWNAADEEQFEARFHRNGQTKPVSVDYMIAHGTIDEFLSEKVNEKRRIFGETVQGWSLESDESALRELSEKIIANRL